MQKLLSKIFLGIFVFSTLPFFSLTAEAGFNDVPLNHPNYTAINALEQTGVLEGYQDGTFKPNLQVNRAEFLKIIIDGSDIPKNININTPFNDVDESKWYGPYLRKAYNEGWIQGYSDGSFRPTQTINKAEALKIIALAQNWQTKSSLNQKPFFDVQLDDWFAPFAEYAKSQNFIPLSSTFNGGKLLSRAEISEIIYQSRKNEINALIASSNNEETQDEDEVNEEEEEEEEEEQEEDNSEEEVIEEIEDQYEALNFTPRSYNEISYNFYQNILLDQDIPNTFYKNEVYYIEGRVISGNYDQVTLILEPEDNDQDTIYIREDTDGDDFSVALHFQEQGNYSLGLLPGSGGTSKAYAISVLPELPESQTEENSSVLKNLDIEYHNGKTVIESNNDPEQIVKVSFFQNGERVSYINRQGKDHIQINYSDFANYEEEKVYFYAEMADLDSEQPLRISKQFSKSETENFNPTLHEFDEVDREAIEIVLPETLAAPNTFTFTANLTGSYAAKTAYAIRPDGFVDEIELTSPQSTTNINGSTVYGPNASITYSYTPEVSGTYIIEINNQNGQAIVNSPLYIGNEIPLLPNYFDLNQREFYSGSLNITSARNQLLDLINEAREDHGLEELNISPELNDFAQDHSADMADNDYFAHINLEGESPNDRRIEAGITTAVSENIAKDVSIRFAHEGLMRSASHRQNILTPEWERVGLGIIADEGYLYVTQEFSTNPLDSSDLAEMKNELLASINSTRNNEGNIILSENADLMSVAFYINDQKINEDRELDNTLFSEALNTFNINGSSKAIGRSSSSWSNIIDSLLDEEAELYNINWQRIGIDISTDSQGTIHCVIILNNQS